jgi:acetylornithine deacetylase/succinyl-diaminopimelate desuccinylase-like protein
MELRGTISDLMASTIADLERLVRIPSCGFPGFDPENVRHSAAATAEIFESAGFQGVRTIEIPGGHPAVFGGIPAPEGRPTILLYAHHDVQPPGPLDEWDSPPYEPAIRDGRLYGRGSNDDKAGIVIHAAAVRAWNGKPPVGVKVLVEGEEECTAEHLDFLIGAHMDLLSADAVVVADAGMWKRGVPAITTSIRGVVSCLVEVRVADKALHSGVYGSAVPDAITSLARIIAALHDEKGNVAVSGLHKSSSPGPHLSDSDFRQEAGVREGVQLIGDGELIDRLWRGPSISVVGIDAPSIAEASYQVVPVAKALVTMRIAPTEDPSEALSALMTHIEAAKPWGVELNIQGEERARGYEVDTANPYFEACKKAMKDAWGVEAVDMGEGGSIPLVPEFASSMPGTAILMTGPADELAAAHSVNESVGLEDLEKACLAEALLFEYAAAL